MNTETPFEKFLNQHDEEAWSATLVALLRSIHEVDRNATQIWFAFYPLSLFHAFQEADDAEGDEPRALLGGVVDADAGDFHLHLIGARTGGTSTTTRRGRG